MTKVSDVMGEFIDFGEIINQIYKQALETVYEFNLMIVGLTGTGKSTLVKSLFQGMVRPSESSQSTEFNEYTESLIENQVQLKVRCIETSNFDVHKPEEYVKYIEDRLGSYFHSRRTHSPWEISDPLIHCCLYLIPTYGKMKLSKEDIECMKALHERVNLVPVIAKADLYSAVQLQKFKENVMADLDANKIQYFKFQNNPIEDEELSKMIKAEAERFPFAIIAADEASGNNLWIRETVAGEIDIRDKKRCDFDSLFKLLVRYSMLYLIDSTHEKHYNKYKMEMLKRSTTF